MKPLIDKEEFIGLEECTWLYTGAESPPLLGGLEAIEDYIFSRRLGPAGREHNTEIEESCKRNLATLLAGQAGQIALVSNSSEAISMIAASLDLKAGDNIVINNLEFPSGVLPWLVHQANGVEVRVVQHRDWEVSLEDIMAQVDQSTRLVMTSHVSYLSGARLDYKALYQSLQQTNALLLLDVTQALGAVPVDMNHADFVVCSSYKWLLGTHGAGILAINPQRTKDFASRPIGWRSVADMLHPRRYETFTRHADARAFELGYPSYPTIYALSFSTNLILNTGPDKIEAHILGLGSTLIDALNQNGHAVMTPREPERRAGNISFVCMDGERVAQALREEGVFVWGGDNRVRASVHAFNDEADVDRLITALRKYWQPR
jgi:selenocysteine lyase/cysteine desulfurase